MRLSKVWASLPLLASWIPTTHGFPALQSPLLHESTDDRNVSIKLFAELEELARIVDISYCVGTTGIQEPFQCASRCKDFQDFELVTTWNTGPLMSDSCGYVVLSHPPSPPRIILAFRGTYSIANTVVDLSTVPQEYVPYPPDAGDDDELSDADGSRCPSCSVHSGFLRSWRHTRPHVLPQVERLVRQYPLYRVTLVGHSLGGAVAALASLDFQRRGWTPQVTTFGEPRVGNKALNSYIDARFETAGGYRRVTHVGDPIPLLPLREWHYRMHAGEIYIAKPDLPPSVADMQHCDGDEDPRCIAGADRPNRDDVEDAASDADEDGNLLRGEWWDEDAGMWTVPPRFRMWELFFAHRDYFWRLGLCVPGGDPKDWWRDYPPPGDEEL